MTSESNITCDNALLSRGFVQIPVLILQDADLQAGAKIVYGGLLWYKWRGLDYPGHAQAATDWGMSERSVCTFIGELSKRGLVEETRPGLGKPNYYHLPDPIVVMAVEEPPRNAKFA